MQRRAKRNHFIATRSGSVSDAGKRNTLMLLKWVFGCQSSIDTKLTRSAALHGLKINEPVKSARSQQVGKITADDQSSRRLPKWITLSLCERVQIDTQVLVSFSSQHDSNSIDEHNCAVKRLSSPYIAKAHSSLPLPSPALHAW